MDDVAPSGLSCLCVFDVGDIAERCPYIYVADFQGVVLAGQKDARNERPYIYFPGFQGVAVAGQKAVQNVRPYIFLFVFSGGYGGGAKGCAQRASVYFLLVFGGLWCFGFGFKQEGFLFCSPAVFACASGCWDYAVARDYVGEGVGGYGRCYGPYCPRIPYSRG